MPEHVYFDWNATAPLRPEARTAMLSALDATGNPSSVHAAGRAARRLVEDAREKVAALIGSNPREVVFTSGGTEANTLALSPQLGATLLVSAIEHPSVGSGGRFASLEIFPVTSSGVADLAALESMLKDRTRPLVSLMLANNETGAIQPGAEAAALVHAAGGLLHVDAVQGPGRIACDFKALGADLMTLSSHKIGGPQGVGALVVRDGLVLDGAIRGGGQERGMRAGTENVAGIAGFGAAADAARLGLGSEGPVMSALRDKLEAGIKAVSPGAVFFGAEVGAASQHHAVFGQGHEGGDRRHRLRPRRGRRVVRGRLFVGQGGAVACSRRHGGRSGAVPWRNTGESRICNHRLACWDDSKGLGEAFEKPI